MSFDLGVVDINGTATERTWRITIEAPVEGKVDPGGLYFFVVHREIIVRDLLDKVVKVIRDETEAAALGYTDFKAQYRFIAQKAIDEDPTIMSDIISIIETLVSNEKSGG